MMPSTTIPAIEVRTLTHIYPGEVEALKEVDLVVQKGEILGIIGKNGSGKTTLVKHFNGLLKPTSGDVVIFGESTQDHPVHKLAGSVGYLFQNPDQQLFLASVEEEVNFGPTNLGMPEDERKESVEHLLDRLELSHVRKDHPFSLTKLNRKLLSIASVLAMKPQVIVFDEPTTGQDAMLTKRIMNLLIDVSREGRTLVIVSHNMRLVAEHCSRIVVMNDGQVLLDGPPAMVFSQPDILADAGVEAPDITQIAGKLQINESILRTDDLLDFLQREKPTYQSPPLAS